MLKSIPELIKEIRVNLRCISASEAFLEMKDNQGILIDVREPAEFAEKQSDGAINIPRGLLEMKASASYPDSATRIYIHCATGARASLAAEQLQRIGYTQVTVITCDLEAICQV